MEIIEKRYKWKAEPEARNSTSCIVLHHRAGTGDADSIHKAHLAKGWSGIGYHYYIRTDGRIYRGRPRETVGAHCIGKNKNSIGVCFEGNYQLEREMPAAQLKAGCELVGALLRLYPGTAVMRHSDLFATACPGQFFPFDKIKKGDEDLRPKLTSANDITWELAQIIEISDRGGFIAALDKARAENSPLYWGYYKIVNDKK